MKILFTYYPLFVDFNHGSALLTAICREQGIDADYIPATNMLGVYKEYDVIAFSLVTEEDYQQCIPYMDTAMLAGKTVLAGGVYARRGGKIDKDLAHYVCRGEGENIADYLLHGDTRIFTERQHHVSIDGFPMPDLSHVKGSEFHRGIPFLQGLKIYPYHTSRGCPHMCSFCEVRYQPRGIRIKHSIKDDINGLIHDHQPDMIYLFDELPPYYLKEWRDQWTGINIPLMSYIRADIEPDHLRFMIDHGLSVAAFGVESTDSSYRNGVLNKGLTDLQIDRTTKILKENGIRYIPFYMDDCPGAPDLSADRIMEIGGYPIVWKYKNLHSSVVQEA